MSLQSVLPRNPFSGRKQDLAPKANLFKLSFGHGICRSNECQWLHFPPWQVIFDFQHFYSTESFEHIFISLEKLNLNQEVAINRCLLLVLSQFRLSHFRPLGAIYSLVGFCVCLAQTFLTAGFFIDGDMHHDKYGICHICETDATILSITQTPNRQAAKNSDNLNSLCDSR